MTQLSSKLDKAVVVAFLFDLVKLAQSTWQLEKEFDALLQATLTASATAPVASLPEDDVRILKFLLTSTVQSDRNNGEAWLFALLKADIENGGSKRLPREEIMQLFLSLASASKWQTKSCYLSLVEKIVLFRKSKITTSGEDQKVAEIFTFVNQHLAHVVTTTNKTEEIANENVVIQMFDFLLQLIAIPARASRGDGYQRLEAMDSLVDLFLAGQVLIPRYLLQLLDISLFLFLYNNLAQQHHVEMKLCLLAIIIEKIKCKPDLLSVVNNGVSFFVALINSKDPRTVTTASRFVVYYYTSIAADAAAKKQLLEEEIKRDSSLLNNPYNQAHFLHNK